MGIPAGAAVVALAAHRWAAAARPASPAVAARQGILAPA